MPTPHKCPVCDGTGLVSRPPHIAGDVEIWTDSQTGPYVCPACNGMCIVYFGGKTDLFAATNTGD